MRGNDVTEFCNGKMSLKQADFNKLMVRPPGFEPGITVVGDIPAKPTFLFLGLDSFLIV